MFKGSKNVEPEGAHLDDRVGRRPEQRLHAPTTRRCSGRRCRRSTCRWCCGSKPTGWRRCASTRTRFTNEREVVKEERRMRVDNQPYGRLNEIIYDQAFTAHPYKHPTIGSMADLEAASIDDVRDFYHTYYVPENATLVLVGDFDTAQARAAGRRSTSAACRRPTRPVPRDIPKEPPQTSEKRVTLEEPWPLPAVVVAYHITYDGHPDSYPLHIASKVLSDGQSSRIYQKLVYDKQHRGGGVRRRQPHRGSESVLRRGDRAAGADAGGGDRRADRRARAAEGRADQRARAAAHQEPVRARLHPRPRVEPAEGAAARARRRHPQRHHDRRRRVRDLPEHHRGDVQRVARTYFTAGEPAGADVDAGTGRCRGR